MSTIIGIRPICGQSNPLVIIRHRDAAPRKPNDRAGFTSFIPAPLSIACLMNTGDIAQHIAVPKASRIPNK
ncbi:hypothetical protein FACS1894216_11050 [Synergistales bacterium]|nr:hypothetical protein FACS1894216_11050 [Synergistales bacterium]